MRALLLLSCLACLPACASAERSVELGSWDGSEFDVRVELAGAGPAFEVRVSYSARGGVDPEDFRAWIHRAGGNCYPLHAHVEHGPISPTDTGHGICTFSFECYAEPLDVVLSLGASRKRFRVPRESGVTVVTDER